jgi:hypothetical protein
MCGHLVRHIKIIGGTLKVHTATTINDKYQKCTCYILNKSIHKRKLMCTDCTCMIYLPREWKSPLCTLICLTTLLAYHSSEDDQRRVWFVCVYFDMLNKVTPLSKCFNAHSTLVRFITSVHSHVCDKVTLAAK